MNLTSLVAWGKRGKGGSGGVSSTFNVQRLLSPALSSPEEEREAIQPTRNPELGTRNQ